MSFRVKKIRFFQAMQKKIEGLQQQLNDKVPEVEEPKLELGEDRKVFYVEVPEATPEEVEQFVQNAFKEESPKVEIEKVEEFVKELKKETKPVKKVDNKKSKK